MKFCRSGCRILSDIRRRAPRIRAGELQEAGDLPRHRQANCESTAFTWSARHADATVVASEETEHRGKPKAAPDVFGEKKGSKIFALTRSVIPEPESITWRKVYFPGAILS